MNATGFVTGVVTAVTNAWSQTQQAENQGMPTYSVGLYELFRESMPLLVCTVLTVATWKSICRRLKKISIEGVDPQETQGTATFFTKRMVVAAVTNYLFIWTFLDCNATWFCWYQEGNIGGARNLTPPPRSSWFDARFPHCPRGNWSNFPF